MSLLCDAIQMFLSEHHSRWRIIALRPTYTVIDNCCSQRSQKIWIFHDTQTIEHYNDKKLVHVKYHLPTLLDQLTEIINNLPV